MFWSFYPGSYHPFSLIKIKPSTSSLILMHVTIKIKEQVESLILIRLPSFICEFLHKNNPIIIVKILHFTIKQTMKQYELIFSSSVCCGIQQETLLHQQDQQTATSLPGTLMPHHLQPWFAWIFFICFLNALQNLQNSPNEFAKEIVFI